MIPRSEVRAVFDTNALISAFLFPIPPMTCASSITALTIERGSKRRSASNITLISFLPPKVVC
jgi:hypothetical protein